MTKRLASCLLICLATLAPAATTINTNDPGQIATFLTDATLQTFETLDGFPLANFNNGQNLAGNQLSTGLTGLTFTSGGGTNVSVLDLGVNSLPGARSASTVIGSFTVGTTETCFTGGCFVEVFFAQPVSRVGIFSMNNDILFTAFNDMQEVGQVTGTAGNLVGVIGDGQVIDQISIIASGTNVTSFVLDDLVYAAETTNGNEIPEPGTLAMLAGGLLAVAALRRR